jgi:hypothetical protein
MSLEDNLRGLQSKLKIQPQTTNKEPSKSPFIPHPSREAYYPQGGTDHRRQPLLAKRKFSLLKVALNQLAILALLLDTFDFGHHALVFEELDRGSTHHAC